MSSEAPQSEGPMGTSHCAVCFKPANARCSKCKVIKYCGPDHQKSHFAGGHKATCVHLRSAPEIPDSKDTEERSEVSKLETSLEIARRAIYTDLYSPLPDRRPVSQIFVNQSTEEEGAPVAPPDVAQVVGYFAVLAGLIDAGNPHVGATAKEELARIFEDAIMFVDVPTLEAIVAILPPAIRSFVTEGAPFPRTASSHFFGTSPLVVAAAGSRPAHAAWLIEKEGVDVNRPHPARHLTPLQAACQSGDSLAIVDLLLSRGANPTGLPDITKYAAVLAPRDAVTALESSGTALAHICESSQAKERIPILTRLLAALPAGAITTPDESGRRLIDFAAAGNNADVYEYLVQNGADPTPIIFSLPQDEKEGGEGGEGESEPPYVTSYLHLSLPNTPGVEPDFLKLALRTIAKASEGKDVPKGPTGVPLEYLAYRNSEGETPFHRAIAMDSLAAAQAFLEAGADPTTHILVAADGEAGLPEGSDTTLSPLAIALMLGSTSLVPFLINECKADPNERVKIDINGSAPPSIPAHPVLVHAFMKREEVSEEALRYRRQFQLLNYEYKNLIRASTSLPPVVFAERAQELDSRINSVTKMLAMAEQSALGIDAALEAFLDPVTTPTLDIATRVTGEDGKYLDQGWTILHWSVIHTQAPTTIKALLSRGAAALVNVPTTSTVANVPAGSTPLHIAARALSGAAIEALLDAGANAGAVDETGATPFFTAAASPNLASLGVLLEAPSAASALTKEALTNAKGSTALDVFDAGVRNLRARIGGAWDADAMLRSNVENVRGKLAGVLGVAHVPLPSTAEEGTGGGAGGDASAGGSAPRAGKHHHHHHRNGKGKGGKGRRH